MFTVLGGSVSEYSMTLANGGGVDGTRARDRRSRINPRTIDLSTLGTVVVHPDLE
jgi:hypothetical protein